MLKKGFAILLAVLLLGLPAFSAAFSDIDAHWATAEITQCAKLGLVAGKGADIFDPNAPITRAEFVSILNRAFPDALLYEAAEISFSDVTPANWYYPTVIEAASAGLISGFGDGTFMPNQPVTRQDTAILLFRYLDQHCGLMQYVQMWFGDTFSDYEQLSEEADFRLGTLYRESIITGYPDGTFRPTVSVTRAESTVMVCRALAYEKRISGRVAFDDIDNEVHLYYHMMDSVAGEWLDESNALGVLTSDGRIQEDGADTGNEFRIANGQFYLYSEWNDKTHIYDFTYTGQRLYLFKRGRLFHTLRRPNAEGDDNIFLGTWALQYSDMQLTFTADGKILDENGESSGNLYKVEDGLLILSNEDGNSGPLEEDKYYFILVDGTIEVRPGNVALGYTLEPVSPEL